MPLDLNLAWTRNQIDNQGHEQSDDEEEYIAHHRGDDEQEQGDEEEEVSEEEKEEVKVDPAVEARRKKLAQQEHQRRVAEQKAEKAQKKAEARERLEHSHAIQFAKSFAHNDRAKRYKALKSIQNWLSNRENLSFLEMMKIWKGLFYCFWQSDKVPVQQELADSISNLLLPPLEFERSLLLFKGGIVTLRREWIAIDNLRMDKFMTLVRRLIQKGLMALQATQWNEQNVMDFVDCLMETEVIAHDTPARGFAFHFIDCFLTELNRVCEEHQPQPSFNVVNTLLTSFYHLLAQTSDNTLSDRVKKELFDPLLELCATPPLEIETPEPPTKKQKKEANSQPQQQQHKKSKPVPADDMEMDEEDEGDEEQDQEEQQQLDGAAGTFPALHAVIQENLPEALEAITGIMEHMLTDDLRKSNRKALNEYRSRFLEILDHADDEEEEEIPEPVLPFPTSSSSSLAVGKKQGKKRKLEEDSTPLPSIPGMAGSETLGVVAKQQQKKKNKKQRLAAKRRKAEALLGAEPGKQIAQEEQQQEDNANGEEEEQLMDDGEFDMNGDFGGDDNDDDEQQFDEAEFDDEDDDDADMIDMEDPAASHLVSRAPSKKERARLEAAQKQLAIQKKQQSKQAKKRIVPESVAEEEEELEMDDDEEPAEAPQQPEILAKAQKKANKQQHTNGAQSSTPQSKKQLQHAPAAASAPVTPPPAQEHHPLQTPPKSLKVKQFTVSNTTTTTTTTTSTIAAAASSSSAGFSTPQSRSTISHTTNTQIRATAPPSSSKKGVTIMLSANQVKSFNKFARLGNGKPTQAPPSTPLDKPLASPKSLIKPTSMEFFYKHNKNGQEAAARQAGLTQELNDASSTPGNTNTPLRKKKLATPPISPASRAKAADYFFQQQQRQAGRF